MQLSNILIAIPAYNEEKFIAGVLKKIHATLPTAPILVVNDGSQDRTSHIAKQFDIFVVDHQQNLGKGEAIKTAFSFAHSRGFKWLIFLDGDGQHPPEHLPLFVKQMQRGRPDVVLGNRFDRTKHMPFHRQLSNGITSIVISLCAGQRIQDSQCGYRAVRLARMNGIELTSSGFQVESEMLIKLGRMGAAFSSVPVKTRYGQEGSSIHLVADTVKFIKLILKSLWW